MNFQKIDSKNIINIFFFIIFIFYFVFGILLSLYVGLSHDEFHEQQNWEYNIDLIKFFFNDIDKVDFNFRDRFYGVGFQFISQPIQYFIKDFIPYLFYIDNYGSLLLSKHPIIFIFFSISGYFFYKIILIITKNKIFSLLSTLSYLLYPYLLGHAFMNPKDIPFLTVWMASTYYSFYIADKFINKSYLKYIDVFFLGVLTAFLLSIRISGIIIFIQYLVMLILLIEYKKLKFNFLLRNIFPKLVFLISTVFLFTIIFYPIFWFNPLDLITSIKFMSKFPQDACTLTLGKCIKALSMDSIYIPTWFIIKLPLVIIFGIFLIPFSEKKIFKIKNNNIFFGTLILSSIIILLTLIFSKTPIYDEVRHLLFLTPIFYILGLSSLFFMFRKFSFFLTIFLLCFFIFENFIIFPYQYTWFNLPTRMFNISKNFELEYFGISGREISKKIKHHNKNNKCIVLSQNHSVKSYLNANQYDCYIPWQLIESKLERPFYAVPLGRNIKKSLPYNCKTIHAEKINLPFYRGDLIASKLLKCE